MWLYTHTKKAVCLYLWSSACIGFVNCSSVCPIAPRRRTPDVLLLLQHNEKVRGPEGVDKSESLMQQVHIHARAQASVCVCLCVYTCVSVLHVYGRVSVYMCGCIRACMMPPCKYPFFYLLCAFLRPFVSFKRNEQKFVVFCHVGKMFFCITEK